MLLLLSEHLEMGLFVLEMNLPDLPVRDWAGERCLKFLEVSAQQCKGTS